MPEILNTARPQKTLHLTVKIGAGLLQEFAGHVSAASVTPTYNTVTWGGGTPEAQLSASVPSGWALALNVAQNVEKADSLMNFLLKNEGATATFSYGPHKDGVFRVTTTAEIVAPAIGGAVNAYNESTVTMGCAKPTIVYPV